MVPVVIYSRMRRLSVRHVSRTSVFELASVPFCKRVFLAGLISRYWFTICSSGNEYYLRISISHDSSNYFASRRVFMTELRRPVLWSYEQDNLQLNPVNGACIKCPAPCHVLAAPPSEAIVGEIIVSAGLLNRLAFTLFGMPLLVLGTLVWVLQRLPFEPYGPGILLLGMAVACILSGILARRGLPEVDRALKATVMVPTMQGTGNT